MYKYYVISYLISVTSLYLYIIISFFSATKSKSAHRRLRRTLLGHRKDIASRSQAAIARLLKLKAPAWKPMLPAMAAVKYRNFCTRPMVTHVSHTKKPHSPQQNLGPAIQNLLCRKITSHPVTLSHWSLRMTDLLAGIEKGLIQSVRVSSNLNPRNCHQDCSKTGTLPSPYTQRPAP